MTEAQVLAYLLENKKATPPQIARHFKEDLMPVHQALLRLERKGIVHKKKLSYNVEYTLTEKAKNLNRQSKDDDSLLPFVLFLGLATLILLGTSPSDSGTEDETSTN